MSSEGQKLIEENFPGLLSSGYDITGPATKEYNFLEGMMRQKALKNVKMKVAEILEDKKNKEQHEEIIDREGFIVEGIMEYIDGNYMHSITRSGLAKMIFIDRFKLSRIFNKKTGQSIPAYVNAIRLQKAAELLMRSDLCIAKTAYFVGFESVEHFNRVFKKQYGMPPKEYSRLK